MKIVSGGRRKYRGRRDKKHYAKHDIVCMSYLQYGKCDAGGRCNRKHLTFLEITTQTRNLCNNICPHRDEMPNCQYVHLDLNKVFMMEYLAKNICTKCTAYNRKCPKIHKFEINHLLNHINDVDESPSESSSRRKPKATPINDVDESSPREAKTTPITEEKPSSLPEFVPSTMSWADQVEDEEQ